MFFARQEVQETTGRGQRQTTWDLSGKVAREGFCLAGWRGCVGLAGPCIDWLPLTLTYCLAGVFKLRYYFRY